jgi:hypothetical protein
VWDECKEYFNLVFVCCNSPLINNNTYYHFPMDVSLLKGVVLVLSLG